VTSIAAACWLIQAAARMPGAAAATSSSAARPFVSTAPVAHTHEAEWQDLWDELRRAAERGDPAAQCLLGEMYATGNGLLQDYAEALSWFRKAAAQHYAPAQFALGLMYRHGRGTREDMIEAARWYQRAPEQGHAEAQVNLGCCTSVAPASLRTMLQPWTGIGRRSSVATPLREGPPPCIWG
jgi:hypothetical protein